jgi:hypothetical protein
MEEYYSDFPSVGDLETSFRVEPTDYDLVVEEQVVVAAATTTSFTETMEDTLITTSESVAELLQDRNSPKETRQKLLQEDAGPPRRRIHASVRETGYDSIRSYIKTMCNHELLNKNEEVILAREIQILIQWEEGRENLESQLLRYDNDECSKRSFYAKSIHYRSKSLTYTAALFQS